VPEPRLEPRPVAKSDLNVAAKAANWSTKVAAEDKPIPGATATTASDKIEIARVRPVLVAPRQPRQAPILVETTGPATAPTSASPGPTGYAAADFKLPPIAASAITEAVTARPQVTTIAPMSGVPSALAAATQPAVKARGAPPSTLQRQAANLAGGATAPAYHLSGPQGEAAGSYEIQIGAYSSAAEAERQIASARTKAADLIGTAPGVTHPISAGGKPVWRARFGGFQAASATSVCSELRRRQIDCLVAKAQ
jgi:hypothetical protein